MNVPAIQIIAYPVAPDGDWSGVVSPVPVNSPEAKSFVVGNLRWKKFPTLREAQVVGVVFQEAYQRGYKAAQEDMRRALGLVT